MHGSALPTPAVISVNIGSPQQWDASKHLTGITKRGVDVIDVTDPGPREDGGRSGVAGDWVGDAKHHGGSEQAVYLVAGEELEHWARELAKPLSPGAFGENLTTHSIDVDLAVVGTRWRLGTATLVATGPRIPCRTFAWALDERGWVKRFTERARPGAYARVDVPGAIRAGDAIETLDIPGHGITIQDVFRAYTSGERDVVERVVAARVLAPRHQADLEAKLR